MPQPAEPGATAPPRWDAPHFSHQGRTTASSWQLKTQRLDFGRLPMIMGILNVTPDSFSDGGRFHHVDAAVAHAEQLLAEGADILDVGGESTRPYSEPVSVAEERRRVEPVLRELSRRFAVPLSIDTSKAAIAEVALEQGVEIINDVTGLEGDPRMLEVARSSRAGICAMHMQGTPQTMQDNPTYHDVVEDIGGYLRQRREALLAAGIEASRICLDPGIGFGKEHDHNLELIHAAHRYHDLGHPVLVGHSRKGFIAKILGDKERPRAGGTAGVAIALAMQGIQVLRVHDVGIVKDTLRLFDACGGLGTFTGDCTASRGSASSTSS